MTEQQPEAVPQHKAGPDTRLAQLHAMYADAKARADAAAVALKQVTDGIKAELQPMVGDGRRVDLLADAYGPRLSLTYVERHTVDALKLKAEAPEIYVRFAKKTGAWQLKAVRGPS